MLHHLNHDSLDLNDYLDYSNHGNPIILKIMVQTLPRRLNRDSLDSHDYLDCSNHGNPKSQSNLKSEINNPQSTILEPPTSNPITHHPPSSIPSTLVPTSPAGQSNQVTRVSTSPTSRTSPISLPRLDSIREFISPVIAVQRRHQICSDRDDGRCRDRL